MSKYLVLILGVIVFFGALFYMVFVPREEILPSSVVAESESGQVVFKEYVSKELDFSIAYPQDWTFQRSTAGLSADDYSAVIFNAPGVVSNAEVGVLPNIAVNYYKNLGVLLSFEEIEDSGQTLEAYLKSSLVVKEVTPATLAGLPAWKGKVVGLVEGETIDTVFVEHGGHVYAIGVSNRENFDQNVEEAMIRSFKLKDVK